MMSELPNAHSGFYYVVLVECGSSETESLSWLNPVVLVIV